MKNWSNRPTGTYLKNGAKILLLVAVALYLTRTATWRSSSGSQLLLSFRRPHRPVATSTVARWLRSVLEASGIDMEIFRAHSTRGAATSAAAKAGISTEHILKTVDWRRASTFRRFYWRDIASTATPFQDAVLSSAKPVSDD